jgi:hypothetical protein
MKTAALLVAMTASVQISAQAGAEAILDSATMEVQVEYLTDRTRVYDGYRAIRDDLFRKLTTNAVDSLNNEKLVVEGFKSKLTERDVQIETLNADLEKAREERDQAIRTKDSFEFLGLQLQKGIYNSIMWILVLGLLALAILLFLMFKRSHVVTTHTKKELANVQEEFEEYRKSSREKYEKLVVSHHNEIMKLKKS